MTPRPCNYTKYGFVACGMLVEWDGAINRTREVNNGLQEHTKENCIAHKNKQGLADAGNKAVNSSFTDKPTLEKLTRQIEVLSDKIDELKQNFVENKELKEALAKASFKQANKLEGTGGTLE